MHDIRSGENLSKSLRPYALVSMVVFLLSVLAQTHSAESGFIVADARTYRHCHNLPTRTYCHKKDALPMNWPPFSDRHRNKPEQQRPCKKRSGDCVDHRLGEQYKASGIDHT